MRISPLALVFATASAACTHLNAHAGLDAPLEVSSQSETSANLTPVTESSSVFIGSLGITEGGRALYTVHLADGSTEVVRSGALFQLGSGVLWRVPDLPLSMQLTANWHFDTAGKISSASFSRFPIEGIAYYHPRDDYRLGLGVRYALSPVSKATINGTEETVHFKNARGTILEAGGRIDKDAWVNLRFVWERYQPNSCSCGSEVVSVQGSPDVNGFHVGINFVLHWNEQGSSQPLPLAARQQQIDWERDHKRDEHHHDEHDNKQRPKEETVTRNIVIIPSPPK